MASPFWTPLKKEEKTAEVLVYKPGLLAYNIKIVWQMMDYRNNICQEKLRR